MSPYPPQPRPLRRAPRPEPFFNRDALSKSVVMLLTEDALAAEVSSDSDGRGP
jgi:hypothetical protein